MNNALRKSLEFALYELQNQIDSIEGNTIQEVGMRLKLQGKVEAYSDVLDALAQLNGGIKDEVC